MESGRLILLILVAGGVLTRNALIVTAAAVVLICQVLGLYRLFPIMQNRGLEVGLIFLLMAVLVPFATGEVGWVEIRESFTSKVGLAAVAGGIFSAVMSGWGIGLMKVQPQLIVGMVAGTILGVVLFKGIPVGPLAAAGFAAILLSLMRWL
ncbi:MAG TPA: DUF441 domain-containing protein [Symbiobacteriaceae bacterium]|nr:DUF441 domain-containing protein [Symbiobacteriaceae bacterium]